MRRLLSTIPLILSTSLAAAPDCGRMRMIAETLEKEIQEKRIGDKCSEIKPADLSLDEKSIGFPEINKDKESGFDYRCKDYSAIEMQLKTIENEIALFNGITNLKNEINEGLETLKKFPNKNIATEATTDLFKNLKVAKNLELFLATNNNKSENILSKLAADKTGWKDFDSFVELLKKNCQDFNKENKLTGDHVCSPGFKLTQEVYKEINDFTAIGKQTERKFNKSQIKDLSKALDIEKDEKKYTYTQLLSELKQPDEGKILTEEDLKKIQALPKLKSPADYSFLKEIKSSIEKIESSKSLVTVQNIPQRFQTFLTDLKNRQIWEMKSKMSLIFSQFPKLPETSSESCLKARSLEGPIDECLQSIAKSDQVNPLEKEIINDLNNELAIGHDHIKKLEGFSSKCVPDSDLKYPEECHEMLSLKMADLLEKSNYLNALKTKILQESSDRISLRNFLLEKIYSNKCGSATDSSISNCSADIGNISKEAVALSSEANNIIFVLQNPKSQTDIEKICEETKETIPFKDEICELDDEEIEKEKNVNQDFFQASVDPVTRNRAGEDFSNFTKTLLSSVATAFTPPPQPIRPYTSNYPMVAPLPPAKHIVTQVMEPALMTGYGVYRSHPGLTAYSPSGAGGGARPYTFSTSSYFNYPTGQ